MAQLNGNGYYRIRNADRSNEFISIANDFFNISTCISNGGGLDGLNSHGGTPYALNGAKMFLRNDIHLVNNQTDIIRPSEVIYAKRRGSNYPNQFNLIAQGTSLLTLTSAYHNGNVGLTFENLYLEVLSTGGSGENTQYTASMTLQPSGSYSQYSLGKFYFVDSTGVFNIDQSYSDLTAKWNVLPLTYFNVNPDIEFNGKYYTTLYVPFSYTLGENINKAYVIHSAAGGALEYEVIASTGDSIPAGTPVILECNSQNESDCKLYLSDKRPIYTKEDPTKTGGSPRADETTSYYSGTNILKGTYFCNTDSVMSYTYLARTQTGSIFGIPIYDYYEATTKLYGDHYSLYNKTLRGNGSSGNSTTESTQKYILGITARGNLGFVKATETNPSPKGIMPANKAWMIEEAEFTDVAMPIFSIPAGVYDENPLTVTLSCATPGAVIHYTINGTTPTVSSPVYSSPITLTASKTIKAIAVLDNSTSAVASNTYTLKVAKPVITFERGSSNTATITCATEGATIYYTTGTTTPSNPTNSSTVYTDPITVDGDLIIKARAYKTGLTASDVATATYKTSTTSVIASPTPLTINDSGMDNIINVSGYTLNVGSNSTNNQVNLTKSNTNFGTTLTATTGSASSTYFSPSSGSLSGKVAVTYNGLKLKDSGTITLTYATKVNSATVKAAVTVNYVPDIYIVTNNGTSQWDFNGAKMTCRNGIYTATFIAPADNTYILFSRKASLASNEQWGTRYVFGPKGTGDWVMPSDVATRGDNIDVNDDNPIKLPYAGEYTITINTNISYYPFSITRKMETVATPTFSPTSGSTIAPGQTVTISCATDGATISYSTDGGETWTVGNTVTPSPGVTIQAKATKEGWYDSDIATATYTVTVPEITVDPESLTINDSGTNNTFTVTGRYLITNVGVNQDNPPANFNTTCINGESWGFNKDGNNQVNGTVAVNYDGRALRAEGDIPVATQDASTSVHVTYIPDIYIVTDNGVQNQWNYNGAQMTNNNGVYTATFIAPLDNTYILFARKASLGENERWNTRFVFGPNSNGDWPMNADETTKSGIIDVNDDDPIWFKKAGKYFITIDVTDANNPTFIIKRFEENTLSQIENNGTVNNLYTISDALIGAWAVNGNGHRYLWAKDMGQSIDQTSPVDGQTDYMKDILGFQHNPWDQSNWIILDCANLDESINPENFVGKKLNAGTVSGLYAEGKYSGQIYGNFRMTLTQAPTGVYDTEAEYYKGYGEASPQGGTTQNPNTDVNYTWHYNTYGPANFYDANLNAPYGSGFVAPANAALGNHAGEKLFFMNPKAQEVARISAVYAGNNKFTVYKPDPTTGEVGAVNAWALTGAFNVNWEYNCLDGEHYGAPNDDLPANYGYIFHAVIGVNPTTSSNAPRRALEADQNSPVSSRYTVYPLDLSSFESNKTAVKEVMMLDREVKSVTYIDIMGHQSSKPFEGINIVVTRYTDGTTSTTKVLR